MIHIVNYEYIKGLAPVETFIIPERFLYLTLAANLENVSQPFKRLVYHKGNADHGTLTTISLEHTNHVAIQIHPLDPKFFTCVFSFAKKEAESRIYTAREDFTEMVDHFAVFKDEKILRNSEI